MKSSICVIARLDPSREVAVRSGEVCTLDLAAPEISPALFRHLEPPGRTPATALLGRLRATLGAHAAGVGAAWQGRVF